jgi:hypothetical protein
MKITINEVANKNDGCRVHFSTEYGRAVALWNGKEPEINKEYFVEIEVPGILFWQKDIVVTDEPCIILSKNNLVHIVALLEFVEDEEYTVLRLGDSIISIETCGEPPKVGSKVKFTTHTLVLHEVMY